MNSLIHSSYELGRKSGLNQAATLVVSTLAIPYEVALRVATQIIAIPTPLIELEEANVQAES